MSGDPILLDAALIFLFIAIAINLWTILKEKQDNDGLPGDKKDPKTVKVKEDE